MTRHLAPRSRRSLRPERPIAAAALVLAVVAGAHAVSPDATNAGQQGTSSSAAVAGDQLTEASHSADRRARAAERDRRDKATQRDWRARAAERARKARHGHGSATSSTREADTSEPATEMVPATGQAGAGQGTTPAPDPVPTPAPPVGATPPAGGPGPATVDLTPQGATSTATDSPAGIVAAINAAPAGSTVLIPTGTYGAVSVNRQIGTGTVRVQPAPGATVTIASVDLTGAAGLDWRGINTTAGVKFQNTSRVHWRGGTHTLTANDTGFLIHAGSRDITVEDVTVRGADCSFYLQASDETSRPTGIVLQRFRSENVHQDHVFISRGSATIQDFLMHGHTESGEHQDGVQIVGGKNVTVRRGTIANDRAFRDSAQDRNDHGVMINYTPGEGRVPETIALEDLHIHDMTSTGVAVAGVHGLTLRRVNAHDNGPGGRANDLVLDPDPGNVITGLLQEGNTFPKQSIS